MIYPPGLVTSIFRTNVLTDSSTSLIQIVIEYDKIDNSDSCSDDFDKKISISTDSSARAAEIEFDYDGVNNDTTSSIFETSLLRDLSTSGTWIMIKFNEVDASGGTNSKLVKKLLKSQKIIIKLKKP